jgi:hypothetical protein
MEKSIFWIWHFYPSIGWKEPTSDYFASIIRGQQEFDRGLNMKNSMCFVCFVLMSVAIPDSVADVLTANDPMGTSSFNSAGMWSDANAPCFGNAYSTDGYLLRTPSIAGNYTFEGDSLTIGGGNGGGANPFLTNGSVNLNCLLNKTPSSPVITLNNLILDAGYIRDGMATGDVWTIAGTILVTENGGGLANQCRFNIDSVVSGSGTLYVADNGNPDPQRTIYWNSGANTYDGSIRLLGPAADRCRLTFSDDSRMNFTIGASGVNNSISGTGTATYNGDFHIDLMRAGVNLGDNWTLTAATVQTFGETFTVAGFDNAGSGYWTKTFHGVLYRFNQNTGKLRVMETLYSGSGTAEDPYQIWTAEQMNALGMHAGMWASHIKLMADLDMSAYTGTQNTMIGNKSVRFFGTFDGNGHVISNLTIAASNQTLVGLFGVVGPGGQVRNLGLINVNIAGFQSVGGLVGRNEGTITACYATGSISGYCEVGGLVGINYQGTITACYATDSVSGSGSEVGGLVGINYQVKGVGNVGGLAGFNGGPITACYATGSVSGSSTVGGLVGGNSGSISSCYATGMVNSSFRVGGVLAYNYGSVTNCFWDTQTSGIMISNGGTGKTTAEMKTLATFTAAEWDFEHVWGIGQGQTYPYLRRAPAGDLNHDGRIDIADFAIFSSHWMEGV